MAGEVLLQLENAIRQYEPGIRISTLDYPASVDSGLVTLLTQWAQVPYTSLRDLAITLGRSLEVSRRLFIAQARDSTQRAAWHAEGEILAETCSKIASEGLCLILTSPNSFDEPTLAVRLDIGWPVESECSDPELLRWSSYLIERIAWHTGGELDASHDLMHSCGSLAVGDERDLERKLKDHSYQRYQAIPAGLRQRLESLPLSRALPDELSIAPSVPGHHGTSEPVPWLARALLMVVPDHSDRRTLRAIVNCRPLVRTLLSRCLMLEAKVKDTLLPYLCDNVALPDECASDTVHALQRLAGHRRGIENDLVPPGHPLAEHPWELATLGTIQVYTPRCPPYVDKLRRIRNAIAHGVPIGWHAMRLIDAVEQAVDADRAGSGRPHRPI